MFKVSENIDVAPLKVTVGIKNLRAEDKYCISI